MQDVRLDILYHRRETPDHAEVPSAALVEDRDRNIVLSQRFFERASAGEAADRRLEFVPIQPAAERHELPLGPGRIERGDDLKNPRQMKRLPLFVKA